MPAPDEPPSGEVLKANLLGPREIQVGMEVVSLNGQPLGRVKEVGENEFLIDRPMARDIYVPFRFVLADEAESERFRGGPSQPQRVVLTLTEGQVDSQHWRHP
jgi:hypothetical protein